MHEENKPFLFSAVYESVTTRMENRDGKPFWVRFSPDGIQVFDKVSGGGNHEGNPIEISAHDLFDMVGEMTGPSGTKFKDRAAFNVR